MSPLVLFILIVSVLGDDSAESGEQLQYNVTLSFIIVKPRPKSQTPKAQPQLSQTQSKSVLRGLGLTLKSYGPPMGLHDSDRSLKYH